MSEIVEKECRFVLHIPKYKSNGIENDYHMVKEQIHYDDGVIKPNIKFIKNFPRSYYVTKKSFRNHFDKKEFEHVSKLDEYVCTESDLVFNASKSLGLRYPARNLKELNNSPYLYYTDISSSVLIKELYNKNVKNETPYGVCGLDIETSVIPGIEGIILITVIYENKIHIAYLEKLMENIVNPSKHIEESVIEYIQEYMLKHGYELEITSCANEGALILSTFKKLHEWKPDWVTIWNMDFDIPRIMEACERNGLDLKDVFSDPCIPQELRTFKYRQGRKFKITASGKYSPIPPSQQWHTVESTSSFYVIDGMCAYRRIRMAGAAEPSYALDNILQKVLGIRKLKFTQADKYQGLAWHAFMQKNYPIEYAVYNIFDVISMLELDLKTKDLAVGVPSMINNSEPSKLEFQPKLIADAFASVIKEKGFILGTVGRNARKEEKAFSDFIEEDLVETNEDEEEENDEVLSIKDWIINLPSHLLVNNGLKVIEELPDLRTNMRGHVYDADATAAYPSCIMVANVSKETTFREVITIEGIDETLFRKQNMNLMSGDVNAIEYCVNMFQLPNLDEMLEQYISNKR